MRAVLTEDQLALQDVARRLAASGLEQARASTDGATTDDATSVELLRGFAGTGVPEVRGGHGGSLVDVAVMVEALAHQVTPTVWVSHQLAVQTAARAGLDVTDAVGGQPWALATTSGATSAADAPTVLVPDGAAAEVVVVVRGESEVTCHRVEDRESHGSTDATRPVAALRLGPVEARREVGPRSLDAARVLLAADLAGCARGAVELGAAYARTREQFGVPIGRFQGVAHQLAAAVVGVEAASGLALYAAWSVEEGVAEGPRAVHAALSRAGRAAVDAAERSLQVHGGLGVTWEADPHLYLRRALATSAWLGSSRQHERTLGGLLVAS